MGFWGMVIGKEEAFYCGLSLRRRGWLIEGMLKEGGRICGGKCVIQ